RRDRNGSADNLAQLDLHTHLHERNNSAINRAGDREKRQAPGSAEASRKRSFVAGDAHTDQWVAARDMVRA
uniref:hypothetical protein n=1 Tax=Microbacterium sp. 4NA327F11 TaxID=2502229 RepID=UPI001BB2A0C4